MILSVVLLVLIFIFPSAMGNAILLALSLSILASARLLKRVGPVFAGVAALAVTFFVIQGLVYPGNTTPFFSVGPVVFYREGGLFGLSLALRLYNILSATLILVLTTRPSDLVESLMRRGLSPRFGYVVISVLQIIPNMAASVATITDAQRSRGMETEGGLWIRVKAFIPLMGPLVTSSLIATEERALALEVRGFSGSRTHTFLHEEIIPKFAVAVRVLSLAVLLVGIAGRVVLGWQ
jgi:energy-coupling factor transport system permease protein